MSGMLTSLITMSYPSFLSRSNFKASLAKPHVVTEKENNNKSCQNGFKFLEDAIVELIDQLKAEVILCNKIHSNHKWHIVTWT